MDAMADSYEAMANRVRMLERERGGQMAIIAALVRRAGGLILLHDADLAAADPTTVRAEQRLDGLLLATSDRLAPAAGGKVGNPGAAFQPRDDTERRNGL
jgi:hypothetical protein